MCRLAALTLLALPLLAAACGGSTHTVVIPDEGECASAWNAPSNAPGRAAVARLVRRGYSVRAGIVLRSSDAVVAVNPGGCSVVVHDRSHAAAYYARRDFVTDGFAFISHDVGLDGPLVVRGRWADDRLVHVVATRGEPRRAMAIYAPANATLSRDGTRTADD